MRMRVVEALCTSTQLHKDRVRNTTVVAKVPCLLTRGVAVIVHCQRVCTHRQKLLHRVRVAEICGQR